MNQNSPKLVAALVIACLALALAMYAALRGPGAPAAGGTCADQEARDRIEQLRRALAERDALVARLARAASAPAVPAEPSPPREAPAEPPPEAPAGPGRPRYARFETPNPAVSVTQNADGSYEIRTTDPALAGSVMQVTAVTASGAQDKVFIRIPQ
jgi:hypothetical protein